MLCSRLTPYRHMLENFRFHSHRVWVMRSFFLCNALTEQMLEIWSSKLNFGFVFCRNRQCWKHICCKEVDHNICFFSGILTKEQRLCVRTFGR